MNLSKYIDQLRTKKVVMAAVITAFLTLCAKPLLSYLNINFSLNNLALLLIPLIVYIERPNEFSFRYGIWTVLAFSLYLLSSAPFFLVLSIGFASFLFLEIFFGKINLLAPIALLLITPIIKYFFDVFGFPIRLFLSQFSVELINFLSGASWQTAGNIIVKEGVPFSVEPECMGLKLVITSFLTGLMIIAHFERTKKISFKWPVIIFQMLLTIVWVVLNNFIRINVLILSEIKASDPLHDWIGIIGFLGLVILPQYCSTQLFSAWFRNEKKISIPSKQTSNLLMILSSILIVIVVTTSLCFERLGDMKLDEQASKIKWSGYSTEVLPSNVVKMEGQHALIYIKPPKPFYTSDHSPFLCWSGSGFKVIGEQIKERNGYNLCFATLQSSSQQLHTVWFHDNGKHKTASQLDWRFRSMKGESPFRLVNISASNYDVLLEELDKFLENDQFSAPKNL